MKDNLTNRQIAFIIFGIVIGYGVINIPKNVAENAGTGGWVSIIIGTCVAVIFTYIITYLGYVYKDKTIYEYCRLLTGKTVGSIIITIYYLYFFILFTIITRVASETIKLTVLLKTPEWVITLVFILVALYAVITKLRTIARICEIYGSIVIILMLILHIAILTQGELSNIKPFFVMEDIPIYFKSTMSTIFPFLGIEILMIIPFNRKENHKSIFKYTTFMVIFIGLLYILIVESCISVIGVEGIIQYQASLYATIRRIDIRSFQFLRRLDSIFLIWWIIAVFCTITLLAYGCVFLIRKQFHKEESKLLPFIVTVAAFVASRIPDTLDQMYKILDWIGYASLFTMLFAPLILLIITRVKKYDKKAI